MLIKLEVENFRSIKDNQIFYTIERNYKRFPDHVHSHKNVLNILKTCLIYGGNGVGKTNLFKALDFIKKISTQHNYLFSTDCSKLFTPFRLDKEVESTPSVFKIDFLYNETIFSYEIKIQDKTILFEELILVTSEEKSSEISIFKRETIKNETKLSFSDEFLNQLAPRLSQIINIYSSVFAIDFIENDTIANAKNWFRDKLEFIFPTFEFTEIAYILSLKEEYLALANKLIQFSNTGIFKLKIEKVPIDIYLGSESKESITNIIQILKNKTHHSFQDQSKNYCVAVKEITNEKEQVVVLRLITTHLDNKGDEIIFELDQESKGTFALINLLPAFILSYGEGVNYFIDDINTSLHPVLLTELLRQYYTLNIKEAKGQLIFNSHEDQLFDETMVRQDEVWLVDKTTNGSTVFTPFSDFKTRHDLNWRRNYLTGMFNGIPFTDNPIQVKFSDTLNPNKND